MDDDGSSETPGAPPPKSKPAAGEAPSLRAQLGATIEAVKRLFQAHLDLAKAEISEIAGAVGRMVGLFAAAFVLLLFVANLLFIGGLLFLGEWLFGSIGWGVLLGTLLLIDLAIVAVLIALDVTVARAGVAFGIALAVGVIVGVVMALDLTHAGWTALGDSVAAESDPNTRAVLLAIGVSAAVLGLAAFLTGIRAGARGAFGRLAGGAAVGVLLGLLTVISIPGNVGAAFGVLAWLVGWPILAGLDLMRTGIDGEAMKAKFTPEATIELTKETIEWVRARTPLVPRS